MLTSLPVYRPSQTMVVASLGPVMEVEDKDEAESMDTGGDKQNEGGEDVS